MTVQPPSNRADHRHHPHASKRARSCRKLRYPATPVQAGGDLTVPFAAALLFVFGLATLVVIKTTGGSIAISMARLTVTVSAPQ
jgi:hypothetical protein